MVKPAARRSVVRYLMSEWHLSERRSCRLACVWRATHRYRTRRPSQTALRERLRELARKHPRYGYWRLYRKLRREGEIVNHKRVHRLYREEDLRVDRRPRKRVARERVPAVAATRPNQRWSTDFVADALADGRKLRILNVVDDHTREALGVEVDTSLPAPRVVRVLDRIAEERGTYPATLVCDNGPEFISEALDQWAAQHGVTIQFIQPGRPVQNCFVESFNGRFRDECLNSHWFVSLADARTIVAGWRREYNEEREHGALGGMTPLEFAKRAMESAEIAHGAISTLPTAPAAPES